MDSDGSMLEDSGINLNTVSTWSETTVLDPMNDFDYGFFPKDNLDEAIACGKCGLRRFYLMPSCESCGSKFIRFTPRGSSHHLVRNPLMAKNQTWFHVTSVDNWYEKICTMGLNIHMGTMDTIENIIHDKYSEENIHIWELSFSGGSSIAPWVCPDIEQAWEKNVDSAKAIIGHDFVSYVNIFEAPGSLSFIGNPHKVTVVGMESLHGYGHLEY